MTGTQLKASLRLWKARYKFRDGRWKHWVRKENAARTHSDRLRAHNKRKHWSRLRDEAETTVKHRRAQIRERSDRLWGGSRRITNQIIDIVNGRYRVTSRKRVSVLLGNRASDHFVGNKTADAVDLGTSENHDLKNEISRKLGGPSQVTDYEPFYISRHGHQYRVQAIAGTHGTGPHLHFGVKRV